MNRDTVHGCFVGVIEERFPKDREESSRRPDVRLDHPAKWNIRCYRAGELFTVARENARNDRETLIKREFRCQRPHES